VRAPLTDPPRRFVASETHAGRPGRPARGMTPGPAPAPPPAAAAFLAALNAARADPAAYGRAVGVDLSAAAPSRPLAWSGLLAASAQAHSADMAARNYFAHAGSDGSNPGQRMARAGYQFSTWGESIAAGIADPAEALAQLVVDRGVPDLGHRHMLLAIGSPYNLLTEVGIALAAGGSYGSYWTVDAAAPAVGAPGGPSPGPPAPAPAPGPSPGPGKPRPRRWPPRWWPRWRGAPL
jgi:uncharacterized protein YkwD